MSLLHSAVAVAYEEEYGVDSHLFAIAYVVLLILCIYNYINIDFL